MAQEHEAFHVRFKCSELDEERLFVVTMTGQERVSRPFEFRLHVTSDLPLLFDDIDLILSGTATISFGPDDDHPIYGVVRSVQLLPISHDQQPVYELVMVPRLYDTLYTKGSWIYQEKLPKEIIADAFKLMGDSALREGDDWAFSLDGTYMPREYVVQYEETLFNFINRQAEHWGIFYYFDHADGVDKVMFCDMNKHFPALAGFETIGFESRVGTTVSESVRSIGLRQRVVESQISLRDYNYRMPSVSLVTPMQPIDGDGIGDVHETGDHHWTPDEGLMLAGVRSQELFTRKLHMNATSTVRGLRAGHKFSLTGAEPEMYGLAREYIVVGITHRYRNQNGGDQAIAYSNELDLIPAEVTYRPPRVSTRPRIHGVMHAKIDSEADDDEVNVPVDEWGRYKVVMPFDVAGKTGGKATCWIRNCTQAGGSGYGFAQGLHVNTEVLIYHIDGDPDRPVIGGSVANFEQPAEVRRENANEMTMASRQGIRLVFSDAKV